MVYILILSRFRMEYSESGLYISLSLRLRIYQIVIPLFNHAKAKPNLRFSNLTGHSIALVHPPLRTLNGMHADTCIGAEHSTN